MKTFPFKKYTSCRCLCGILAFYSGEIWIVCFWFVMPYQWLPTVSCPLLQDISTFRNEATGFAYWTIWCDNREDHNPTVQVQLQLAYCCTATKLHLSTSFRTAVHICNLANTTAEAKSAIGIRSQFNASIQKQGEDWFEPILNIHTTLFHHCHPIFIFCPSLTQWPK